jgi:tetratricopeptide (TPR) repeat protein
VDETLTAAIRDRIDSEARSADRAAMKTVLLDVRKQFRKGQKEQEAEEKGAATDDYLTMLLSYPHTSSSDWKRLVNVLALSRMCVHLGTVEAVRTLIHVYVRFEFLRIDTQLQLKALGDKSLAALIEATHHPAPEVAQWAKRRLDFLGKAIPSEAIAVNSSEVLADVLRAYGYLRDPDAARLVISFANSERLLVREAARQSVASYGEVANWQLRDAYEQVTGERPAREWSWERTARELFRKFDRTRLADVYQLYDAGLTALERGDLPAMRQSFDKVLARSPNFEPVDKLVEGYFKYAESIQQKDPDAALTALARVVRLGTDETLKARAESIRLTIEATRLAARRLADQTLLRAAIELDAQNHAAKTLLKDIEGEPLSETTHFLRYLWPALLGALSLVFSAIVFWRRPKPEPEAKAEPKPAS